MKFSEWLTKKYIAWRGNAIGNERSISDFAKMVGVSQPTMSHWMSNEGRLPRSKNNIQKLVDALGYEVYDVLGLPRSDASLDQLPPEMRSRLERATTEIKTALEESGTSPDSPEAEQIAIEIMARHGFEYVGSSEDDLTSIK